MTNIEPREYSKLLGVLTPEQLQAALDRFDLGTLVDAQPAPGGLFGQNVFITSSSGEWVLRGRPHYDGQFQKERFFSRLIHEQTTAEAPWPFHIERDDGVFGWHYALMPRLPGVDPGDAELQRNFTEADRIVLARAMGDHLGLLQSATFDSCATYDHAAGDLAPLDVPYADWFIAQVREWVRRCRTGNWAPDDTTPELASAATADADVAWVEEIIEQARDALVVPFAPSIVHTDYKENNTCAVRTSDGWRITGVFDLGEAYIGDGEYDLARSACNYVVFGTPVLRAFIDAYAARKPLRPGFAERMALYILCDRLVIWEYGQRNKIWFPAGLSLRQWCERTVTMNLS